MFGLMARDRTEALLRLLGYPRFELYPIAHRE